MATVSVFFKKLSLLLRRNRFHSELEEEMAFHRAEMERELIASGTAPQVARAAARKQFGNSARLNEQSHEIIGFSVESVFQDLHYAFRQMRKNPGFALTAIFILTLGIGVTVAIFGFVDAALLEPLPFTNPNRLVSVDEKSSMFPRSNLSRADYEDWKRMNHSLSSLEVYAGNGYLMASPDGVVPVPAVRVSDGFLSTLGVQPFLGRVFLPGEDLPGKPKIVILTYGTWLKRFGARRDIVGHSVTLSGDAYTIVGVLPREFAFAPRGNGEFFVPLLDKGPGCESRRSCHNLDGIGRLKDGVTLEAARAEMESIAQQLAKQFPDSNLGQGASVLPLSEIIVGPMRAILLTLLAATGLLLLIACVNVASLLLVRSESRRREIAVRGALGATPKRLVRQFVTEGLLLAIAGGAGGLLVSTWVMILLTKMIPENLAAGIPFLKLVGLNLHTCLFAAAVMLLAALLLAATPILRLSFQDIRDGLGDGDRGSAGSLWRRLGANLVVVELAIAVILLVGAGLLGQSFYRLLHVDNGFDTSHLATVQINVPDKLYPQNAQLLPLYREIERRLLALPGVQSVGLTSNLPVDCNCNTDWIRIVGKPFHGEHNEVNQRDVSPNYFATLKARLVRGRVFTSDDVDQRPHVIVINQTLARKYFPGEDPIGKKLADDGLTPNSFREIVGIVADLREGGLDQELWPAEYAPIDQTADNYFAVAVRTTQDEKSMLPTIVATLHGIDRNLGAYGELTMTDQIETTQSSLLHRFSTWLVGGFAVMAFVLGVVGLYGVIAYSVSRRTREIGVRMALGAQRSAVYGLVMRQAGWLTALGVGIGLVCAVGACMLMRSVLFGVQAWDPLTLFGVALVLGTASMAASFLPAYRAASVSPTEALRTE
ncbi:MAG TPA: ABC transporter permease [Terracidiphilus sp.]|jgi:macrolide transport system ATP-binding/permease protein|nr:ABC transporter permease [Terracidiphilus sp.]